MVIIYKDEEYRIWDAHTHFSNIVARPLKFLLKKLATFEIMDLIFANWQRFKSVAKDRTEKNVNLYLFLLDFYHIDKAIHLPVFKMDRKLSYRMNELYPEKIFGFGYINPRSKKLDEDLQDLIVNNVYGIKIHPDIMKFTFKAYKEELIKIFQFCAENRIIVLSHTGSHSELKDMIPILKKSDNSMFIIGHSGLCPQINQALQVAKECQNSYLEMSGNPYTYKFVEAIKDPDIGVERILFGTDTPSLHPRVEMEKVLALPLSTEEKRLIFSYNLENLMKKFLKEKYKG
jgi:predicted TIM-barrel fold metal-dependent hydrolase